MVVDSVVVVGGSVVVVVDVVVVVVVEVVEEVVEVVVVVGALDGAMFTSNTYDSLYQRFGSPQQTPVLRRYVPAFRFIDMFESRPYQSSLAAIRLLFSSYNHSIESIPYCQA